MKLNIQQPLKYMRLVLLIQVSKFENLSGNGQISGKA